MLVWDDRTGSLQMEGPEMTTMLAKQPSTPTSTATLPSTLLFSDDTAVAAVLGELLVDDGLPVTTCSHRFGLVAQARECRPDVIVIEVPARVRGWGMRLLEELFWDPTIAARVIVLTTDPACVELRLARQSGYVDAVLALPTHLEHLTATVRRVHMTHSHSPAGWLVGG